MPLPGGYELHPSRTRLLLTRSQKIQAPVTSPVSPGTEGRRFFRLSSFPEGVLLCAGSALGVWPVLDELFPYRMHDRRDLRPVLLAECEDSLARTACVQSQVRLSCVAEGFLGM